MAAWPTSPGELVAVQRALARAAPSPWRSPARDLAAAGCFVCFERGKPGPGAAGDRGWAGAALSRAGRSVASASMTGRAGAPYEGGLLALRAGALLEAAVAALGAEPDVLLVNATGRDHPRRAGLALHLGAVLGLPTVGVTHRTLLAEGGPPAHEPGARRPLVLDGEVVGYLLRTRPGTRPLCVHSAWRTDAEEAVEVVDACSAGHRTPEPLREARRLAREARAEASPRTWR